MTSAGNKVLQPEKVEPTTRTFICPPSNRVWWPHDCVGLADPAQNKRTGKRTRVTYISRAGFGGDAGGGAAEPGRK